MDDINPNDEAALRALAGATFYPGAELILPSGRKVTGDEARALTSFYASAAATIPDATRVSYATLLAAYRAEQSGSIEALTYAQHIAERLIADDTFWRLRTLRDELQIRLDDEGRDRQIACEYALRELNTIVGGM